MNASYVLLGSFKYVYIIVFFALLAGIFHPLVNNMNIDNTIIGVLVLLVGLAGGVLLYRAVLSKGKKTAVIVGGGFALIALSVMAIYQLSGKA